MVRNLAVFGLGLAVLVAGSHAAFAGGQQCPWWDLLCWFNPDPGPQPAPAPLLAAGIPAFTAIGGGVLVSRLVRKFRRQA